MTLYNILRFFSPILPVIWRFGLFYDALNFLHVPFLCLNFFIFLAYVVKFLYFISKSCYYFLYLIHSTCTVFPLLIFFNSIFISGWVLFNISISTEFSLSLFSHMFSWSPFHMLSDYFGLEKWGVHLCSPHTCWHSSGSFTPGQADPAVWTIVMLSILTLNWNRSFPPLQGHHWVCEGFTHLLSLLVLKSMENWTRQWWSSFSYLM